MAPDSKEIIRVQSIDLSGKTYFRLSLPVSVSRDLNLQKNDWFFVKSVGDDELVLKKVDKRRLNGK